MKEGDMSLLDGILGQVSDSATVQNLAAKVGLTPEQVESAVAALGQAHAQEGDTVQSASEATGLPSDKLNEIVEHIGGEGSLGQFAALLESEGGISEVLGGLKKFF
jgi:ATP phosphoribosyltransferase regulatory subunit HisZ